MTSKLEKAQNAVATLRKAIEEGEDISKEQAAELDATLASAQGQEILKSLALLKTDVEGLRKQEDEEGKTADYPMPEEEEKSRMRKQEEEYPYPEQEEKKAEELLDLALEEIVRLRNISKQAEEDEEEAAVKQEDGDEAAAVKKQEDENVDEEKQEDEEEEKAVKKQSEPGPADKLPAPGSADYSDKGGQSKLNKQENNDEEEEKQMKDVAEDAVQKAMEKMGFIKSSTPVQPAPAERVANVAQSTDLAKAADDFTKLTFKEINRFRMQHDPALREFDRNLGGRL